MGAKSKLQETVSLADLGSTRAARASKARARGTGPLRAAAARRHAQDRGRRQRGRADRRLPDGEAAPDDPRLPRAPRTASSRRARSPSSKAASLGIGDVAGDRRLGCGGARRAGGKARRRHRLRRRRPKLEAPLPQPRVDAIAQLVEQHGLETVLFAQSILAADIASGLAARPGLNWQLTDLRAPTGARRQAVRARRLGRRRRWLDVDSRIGLFRAGAFDPTEQAAAGVETFEVELQEHSLAAEMVERAHAEESAVDRGCQRDRRRPRPRRAGEVRARRGAREGARRRRPRRAPWSTPAGIPTRPRSARRASRSRRRSTSPAASRGDPAQGRDAELEDDRRDQQGSQRPDLRVRRPRRRRRPAPDRPEAHRASAAQGA